MYLLLFIIQISPVPSANIPEITLNEPQAKDDQHETSTAARATPVVEITITDAASKQAVIDSVPPAAAMEEKQDKVQEVPVAEDVQEKEQEMESKQEERQEVKLKYEYKEGM